VYRVRYCTVLTFKSKYRFACSRGLEDSSEDLPYSLLPALENSALFSDDNSPEPLNEKGEHRPPYWRALVPAWLDAPLSRASAPVAELVLLYLHSLALPPAADLQTVSSAAALVDSILADSILAAAVPAVEEERWDVTPVRSLHDLAALCRRYEELDAIQQELTAIGGHTHFFIYFSCKRFNKLFLSFFIMYR
jgi:hypothetical protein